MVLSQHLLAGANIHFFIDINGEKNKSSLFCFPCKARCMLDVFSICS